MLGKPTIHAVYTLFDVKTGEPLVQLDGEILTNKRTAAALKESGDLAIPLEKRVLSTGEIKGTFKDLLTGARGGRTIGEQVTMFKSVGFALEDLAAAVYLLEGTI